MRLAGLTNRMARERSTGACRESDRVELRRGECAGSNMSHTRRAIKIRCKHCKFEQIDVKNSLSWFQTRFPLRYINILNFPCSVLLPIANPMKLKITSKFCKIESSTCSTFFVLIFFYQNSSVRHWEKESDERSVKPVKHTSKNDRGWRDPVLLLWWWWLMEGVGKREFHFKTNLFSHPYRWIFWQFSPT